ncbi:MAG: hypothetical protein ABL959_17920 [Pyrinomonadaceae bacterium]
MSKNIKILIGVLGLLIFLAAVCVIGGYLGMNYLERNLQEAVKADVEEGKTYGKTIDQQACMTEGLRRSKSMTFIELSKLSSLGAFVEACIGVAKPVKDFCTGVPGAFDFDKNKWQINECRAAGLDEAKTGCTSVFQAKHAFCNPVK